MRLKMHINNLNVIRGRFQLQSDRFAKAYSFCAVSGTYLRVPFKYRIKFKGFSDLIKDVR